MFLGDSCHHDYTYKIDDTSPGTERGLGVHLVHSVWPDRAVGVVVLWLLVADAVLSKLSNAFIFYHFEIE